MELRVIKFKFSMLTATLAALALTGCAPTGTGGNGLTNRSNYELWNSLSATSDTKQIMLIEAELGARGETQSSSGNDYIGRRTSGTVGKSTYGRSGTVSGDRNCSDFATPAGAQRFFLSEGGPVNDPHGLDGDGDGNACEWGKSLQTSVSNHRNYVAQQAAVERRSRARAVASSRCYVGPRGGTYTLTASGNKNYSGC